MIKLLKQYIRDVKGATAVEYGLIVAGIVIVIAASVFLLGESVSEFFSDLPDLIS